MNDCIHWKLHEYSGCVKGLCPGQNLCSKYEQRENKRLTARLAKTMPMMRLQSCKSFIASEFGFQESKVYLLNHRSLDGKLVFIKWEATNYEYTACLDKSGEWQLTCRRSEQNGDI